VIKYPEHQNRQISIAFFSIAPVNHVAAYYCHQKNIKGRKRNQESFAAGYNALKVKNGSGS
jgi:hypothetical protein